MRSIHSTRRLALAALFCLATTPALVQAHAINGAIYTSTVNHSEVNANLYESKSHVYLNGGPSNFPQCTGGALTDGDYHFQVTDPSGKSLLSSDAIWARVFRVSGGRIAANLGTHANGGVSPCGSLSIQLMPYANTPNNGGVYKVWITRTSDFEAACGAGIDCGLDGFVPGHTKTDNFKVRDTDDEIELVGAVRAFKFYDRNANGQYDFTDDGNAANDDPLLENWKMTLDSFENAINIVQYTGFDGSTTWDGLPAGIDYTVEEGVPTQTNWVHSATIYTGHDGSPENPAGPLEVTPGETTNVLFGNYCRIPSNGRTLGFWSNRNGQALFGGDDLAAMVALNLRSASGAHFDPGTYAAFRTWLLGGNATNMAYMLSVQMAAMRLNVLNGFVDGSGYYIPAGMTVNALIAAANTSLGDYGNTTVPHPERAYQEGLKNWLDQLNNGAAVVPATPCAYRFP